MANSTVSAIGEIIASQGGELTATTIAPAIKQLIGSIGSGSNGGTSEMEDIMRRYVIDAQAFEVTVTHDETSDEDTYATTLVTLSDSSWFNEYSGLCVLQSSTTPPLRVVIDGVSRYSFIRNDENNVPTIYVTEDTTYGESPWLALTSYSNSSYFEIEVLSSIDAGMHSIEMWYEYRSTMPNGFANISANGVIDVRDKEYAGVSVIPSLRYVSNNIKMKTYSSSYPIDVIYASYTTGYDQTTGAPIVVPCTGTKRLSAYPTSVDFFCLEQSQSQSPWYHITSMTLLARVEARQQKNKQVSLVVDDAPNNVTVSIARAPEFDHEYNSTLDVYSFLLCINVDIDEDWNSIAIYHADITLDLIVT